MRNRWRRFIADALWVSVAFVMTSLPVVPWQMRALVTTPLVLYLPGSALLRAIRLHMAAFPEREILSVGASLAIMILSGLLINSLFLLSPENWLIGLTAVLMLLSSVDVIRRSDCVVHSRSSLPSRRVAAPVLAMLLGAVVLTGAAFAVAVHGVQTYQPFHYTNLWIVRDHLAGPDAVTIGIKSEEASTYDFYLDVWVGDKIVASIQTIRLANGQSFVTHLSVPHGSGLPAKIYAQLFRANDISVVYRNVSLVLVN